MPTFRDEAHKQEWLAKCAATRARNQKAKQLKPVNIANGFQDETTKGERRHGRPPRVKSSTSGILGAVEEIDSKIAALQQVRKALIHAHELVNA